MGFDPQLGRMISSPDTGILSAVPNHLPPHSPSGGDVYSFYFSKGTDTGYGVLSRLNCRSGSVLYWAELLGQSCARAEYGAFCSRYPFRSLPVPGLFQLVP